MPSAEAGLLVVVEHRSAADSASRRHRAAPAEKTVGTAATTEEMRARARSCARGSSTPIGSTGADPVTCGPRDESRYMHISQHVEKAAARACAGEVRGLASRLRGGRRSWRG